MRAYAKGSVSRGEGEGMILRCFVRGGGVLATREHEMTCTRNIHVHKHSQIGR